VVGITGYGVCVPRLRLDRATVAAAHSWHAPALKGLGKGVKAIADWDEDSVTMGVEAARGCVGDIAIDAIYLASTSLPFADRQNAGIIKEALALPDSVGTVDITGSQRAGVSALLLAHKAVGAGAVLCVAAEKHKAQPGSEVELTSGDGAAAFAVGAEGLIAELIGSHCLSTDFIDHFRAAGSDVSHGWEGRWVRDEGYGKILPTALASALQAAGVEASEIDRLAFSAPMKGVVANAAKTLGIRAEAIDDTLAFHMGHAGTAQSLILLARALEEALPGQTILVAGFGQGCEVLIFRTTDAIAEYRSKRPLTAALARGETTSNYFRYLALNGLIDLDRGARGEQSQKPNLSALYRNRRAVMGLIGGRSGRTGTVQFPKSDLSVDPNDPGDEALEDYRFAELGGTILTYTADRLAYTPSPPYFYGMIAFDGGGRMVAEFADCNEADIFVGARVRMAFRVKSQDQQRGFTHYFWKAVPITAHPQIEQ
jgi:hydroxymethylglutaryl-CoA synthase